MTDMVQSYEWLSNIDSLKFNDKSVLIVGAGEMARHYALALSKLNIKDITIISRTEKDPAQFSDKSKFKLVSGGFKKQLPLQEKKDLVVIATPTPLLLPATRLAVECGQTNILIEKPGSLYHKDLSSLMKKLKKQRVRIAYNRLVYPSFHKLKSMVERDGEINSCRFNFTEWVHRIPFDRYQPDEYNRWGISNSLHVISMALDLIGMPNKISAYRFGKLDWHPSGSIFVGSGISERNIPFSYHANWESAGRWEVEVMTKNSMYRLAPLEELYVCKKGGVKWESVQVKSAFPDVKVGIAEEISLMLENDAEKNIRLVSLEKAIEFNKIAEKIFGYNSKNN